MMDIVLIGINHTTAALKKREKFSFTKHKLRAALLSLKNLDGLLGAVLLSTCNRTEIYAHFSDPGAGIGELKGFLFTQYRIRESDIKRHFYILKDEDAVRHIFRVASGLDSQVLGESEILSQVKSARLLAKELNAIDVSLDEIFDRAVRTGRIVRNETRISHGNISIGTVAIRKCEESFKNLNDKLILIIGAGKIGNLVSKYLQKKGIRGIFVSNRTYSKACELAQNCGGEAIRFNRLREALNRVDIVISSTASPHLVLKKEFLSEIMGERKRPLLVMDLAVPRDVSPQARHIPGITLFDLDDLKSVVEENYSRRQKEAGVAEKIVQRELGNFKRLKI